MPEYLIQLTEDDREYYFAYLEELRDTGVTNMLGAWEWLVRHESLSEAAAKDVCKQWMDSLW